MAFIPIPEDKLPLFIGRGVHVNWANRGCIWILRTISGGLALIQTPSTGKYMSVPITQLCATRSNEHLLT